jgi:nicotinamide-nucleotide amidase
VQVEVINTGSELLLGNVVNTHLAFLGQALFGLGLRIEYQVTVPDGPAIRDALLAAFGRAQVVLVTGGLGPTSDDITRDLAAELVGRPLVHDPAVMGKLENYFQRLGRPVNASVARQAQVPEGAVVLANAHGTAPGLYLPAGDQSPHIFLLPGPPRELRPMFTDEVAPILAKLVEGQGPRPECRIYRCAGMGESAVEELIGERLAAIAGLEIGYCARLGEVDVRCIGSTAMVEAAEEIVLGALGPMLLPRDVQNVEADIIGRMAKAGLKLAVAESCTGGLLAHRLTNVPGSSAVFVAGLTTYSAQAKATLLGVDPAIIEKFGVVSAEVALEMAAGACRVTGADIALATTGEAGPISSSSQPVGTLFLGLAGEAGISEQLRIRADREGFKDRAANAAFALLHRHLTAR